MIAESIQRKGERCNPCSIPNIGETVLLGVFRNLNFHFFVAQVKRSKNALHRENSCPSPGRFFGGGCATMALWKDD
jgi:hypothetical protein